MSDNIKILRNYLLYFLSLLLVCIVGISNVFADEILDTSTWINTTGRQWSLSPQEYHFGNPVSDNNWSKNYFNISSGIYTPPNNFDYITFSFFQHGGGYNPCNGGNYRVNFSLKFSTPNYVNYVKLVKFADSNCSTVSDSNTGIITVNCPVSYLSQNNTYISADFYEISGTSSSDFYISRYINTSCDLNTGAIIDNSTQNTQNIINNNNTNTENIINNQNQNTQQQIESQKVCNTYSKDNIIEKNKYLNISGTLSSRNNVGVTDYLSINSNDDLYRFNNLSFADNIALCFYNSKKSLINCVFESTSNDFQEVNKKFDIPNNAKFVRFSIDILRNLPQFQICKNGNQALNDSITDLTDSLNDDDSSGATSEASEFFSSFTTNTFGLTSIITAPLNLIQSLTSSSCSELHLPLPYLSNKYLDLPCMTSIYQTHFGAFFTMYQTITYGIIAYWVCVRIFNQVKDFKNPEHDEIEVVDL